MLKGLLFRSKNLFSYLYNVSLSGSYSTYYSNLMDKRINDGWGDDVDRLYQLKWLRDNSLINNDTHLLDFGCGPAVAGLNFISFLDESNYTGADISSRAIQKAKSLIKSSGLCLKKPNFIVLDARWSDVLFNKKFDLVWAQSVFTHMPPDDVKSNLKKLANTLLPRGKILCDFNIDDYSQAWSSGGYINNNFSYSHKDLTKLSLEVGLQVRTIDTWTHPIPPKRGADVMYCFNN